MTRALGATTSLQVHFLFLVQEVVGEAVWSSRPEAGHQRAGPVVLLSRQDLEEATLLVRKLVKTKLLQHGLYQLLGKGLEHYVLVIRPSPHPPIASAILCAELCQTLSCYCQDLETPGPQHCLRCGGSGLTSSHSDGKACPGHFVYSCYLPVCALPTPCLSWGYHCLINHLSCPHGWLTVSCITFHKERDVSASFIIKSIH